MVKQIVAEVTTCGSQVVVSLSLIRSNVQLTRALHVNAPHLLASSESVQVSTQPEFIELTSKVNLP